MYIEEVLEFRGVFTLLVELLIMRSPRGDKWWLLEYCESSDWVRLD